MTQASKVQIEPLSDLMGAEVRGVDTSQPLGGSVLSALQQAMLDFHILVFREQSLRTDEQIRFSEYFGPLESHVIRLANGKPPPPVHVISNLDAAGQPTSKPFSHGNYFWHTDKSYHAAPSLATLLHAVELPPEGGDTEFANMHAAYAALDPTLKNEIAELKLVHSWEASRINTGNRPATEEEKRDRPPVTHPLVRTHPDTARKSLYLGTHVSHVVGMEPEASRTLLEKLQGFATSSRFLYRHRWQPGDLVIWDNRSLLHRAISNFDMDRYRRILHRTVVKGSVPF